MAGKRTARVLPFLREALKVRPSEHHDESRYGSQTILDFWFAETTRPHWFAKSAAFDGLIVERFGEVLRQAAAGELAHWRATLEGRLAEMIVLDQFSRNAYRDAPQSFAQDGMALVLAQEQRWSSRILNECQPSGANLC